MCIIIHLFIEYNKRNECFRLVKNCKSKNSVHIAKLQKNVFFSKMMHCFFEEFFFGFCLIVQGFEICTVI